MFEGNFTKILSHPEGVYIKSLQMESLNTPEWFVTQNYILYLGLGRLNGDLYWMLYIKVGLVAKCRWNVDVASSRHIWYMQPTTYYQENASLPWSPFAGLLPHTRHCLAPLVSTLKYDSLDHKNGRSITGHSLSQNDLCTIFQVFPWKRSAVSIYMF